jgi:hypothetical protein
MLERFIEWINTHEDVVWCTMADMAQEFRSKVQPAEAAKLPAGLNSVRVSHDS